MMAFVQVIEMTTTKVAEIEELMSEWWQRPRGAAAHAAAFHQGP
jgi:hypothetical protein